METLGAFPDGEWDCIRRMLAVEEQDHSLLPFLGQSSLMLGEVDGTIGIQSMCYSTSESGRNDESMFYSFDADNSSLHYISQESSHSSNCSDHSVFIANPSDASFYFGYPDNVLAYSTYTSKDYWMMNEKNPRSFVPPLIDIVMEENVSLNEDETSDRSENSDQSQVETLVFSPNKQSQLKRKPALPELQVPVGDEININSSGDQKKKPRVSKDVQRCMTNSRSKKNQKLDRINGNDAEETNVGSNGNGTSSYTYTLEEDNTNQENSEGATTSSSKLPPAALNLNGKTRASRGSATDPQSLYARKRRERINERLRILQNLVPNGTKVDISTMLEEALHYVKFLQLQIKLLSSDDMWMYAPIAYNGLDIGLDLSKKIFQPL